MCKKLIEKNVVQYQVLVGRMAQFQWFYPVLMIPSLAGFPSAAEVTSRKSVCSGDYVQIFERMLINNSDTSVTLYKDGDKHRPIAWWTKSNLTIIQENVVIDQEKNIWIMNVHSLDEGNYIITYDMHNGPTTQTTVELSVWVAPSTTCKLHVAQDGIILTVSLIGNDCGKPRASAYWKNYSGVTVHDEKVLQLQSGKEAGTYYACMKGPALSCAKSSDPSSDHCYPYTIKDGESQSGTGGSKTQSGSDGSKAQSSSEGGKDDLHTWLIVIVFLQCTGMVLPVILFGIYRVHKKYGCSRLKRRRNEGEQGIPLQRRI